eukprot:scaffold69283_cov25-Prasinocladus_malaysianus.AAC.1
MADILLFCVAWLIASGLQRFLSGADSIAKQEASCFATSSYEEQSPLNIRVVTHRANKGLEESADGGQAEIRHECEVESLRVIQGNIRTSIRRSCSNSDEMQRAVSDSSLLPLSNA